MVQRSEAVFDIPSGVTARDVLYNDYIVVDDKEVWLRGKSDPKGGKVMTVRFTGIARRSDFPEQGQGVEALCRRRRFPKDFMCAKPSLSPSC